MTSENGVPMDVCIYCGAEIITHSQNCKHGECGTRYSYGVITQSDICKQIVQLNEENERLRKLVGEAYDAGVKWGVWKESGKQNMDTRPDSRYRFFKSNGLGEGYDNDAH